MTEQEFFANLAIKTAAAFQESPIAGKNQLAYAISATPLRKEKPLILGINWGGSGSGFEAQKRMPTDEDLTADIIRSDYNFLERSKPYFEKYLQLDLHKPEFNYSNLCFFRSRAERDLAPEDYQKSYPLVKELIEYINPQFILALGVTVYQRIKEIKNEDLLEVKEVLDSDNKHRGFRGKFLGHDFYCLPHPNARVKTVSREELWQKVCFPK